VRETDSLYLYHKRERERQRQRQREILGRERGVRQREREREKDRCEAQRETGVGQREGETGMLVRRRGLALLTARWLGFHQRSMKPPGDTGLQDPR